MAAQPSSRSRPTRSAGWQASLSLRPGQVALDVGGHVLVGEQARHEPVDLDPVGTPLDGQGLHHVLDAGLGGGRVGEARSTGPGVGGADVDDRAGGTRLRCRRANSREQKNVPLSVMSTTVRQALGDMSSAGTGKLAAALLTGRRAGRTRLLAASKAAAICSGSRMSQGTTVRTCPPRSSMAASARPSRCSALRLADHDRRTEPGELGGDGLARGRSRPGDETRCCRRRCRRAGRWCRAPAARRGPGWTWGLLSSRCSGARGPRSRAARNSA